MKQFADRLREARVAAGMTQEQLGFALGITKSSVSAWQSGRDTPSIRLLPELRRHLGRSLDELAGGIASRTRSNWWAKQATLRDRRGVAAGPQRKGTRSAAALPRAACKTAGGLAGPDQADRLSRPRARVRLCTAMTTSSPACAYITSSESQFSASTILICMAGSSLSTQPLAPLGQGIAFSARCRPAAPARRRRARPFRRCAWPRPPPSPGRR